ncbi:hypothetical protein TSUD_206390 [Trifolium subterraneum]|uniref:Uncharacterized protein n=1 Tax=Trifolium subterraneum TaxID=3900 RepID=A0A2Z6NAD3_TRISU|nr:hypothetical protein TSUD_206390 [Trifolium subterraneum]
MDFRKYVRDKSCQRCRSSSNRGGAVIIRAQRKNRKRKIALACSTVIRTISSYPCTEDSATQWSLK